MITLFLLAIILLGILPLGFFLFRSLNHGRETNVQTLDEDLLEGRKSQKNQEWWEKQRSKFNWSLLLAGVIAFLLNSILLPLIVADIPQFGFGRNLFLLLLQLLTYLIYIGVANVFFTIGPLVENVVQLNNIDKYRNICFKILQATFVLIPQIIVLILFF